ncbi:MAG: PAS domain S-box protein [Pseudomonadota bacterium]
MSPKPTILAVDDTAESLALLTGILGPAGYQVRPADSGELALAAVAASAPDLILLDVRMPGLDGLEVCRRLKADLATRHIPIILISAFADAADWVQGLQLGAADYISKPFQTDELLTRVQTHLTLRQARAELEAQQQALRASEDKYRTTLTSIGDGVITTDAGTRVEFLNPEAEALTGWSLGEARGRPIQEVFRVINEHSRQTVENPVAGVLRAGRVVGLANHTLLVARDGSERPIADSGAPIRDSQGQITGVVLVFRDQSEERAAQHRLQQSEERYRSVVEQASDGIFISDATGQYVEVNPAACAMLGFSRDELLRKRIVDLIPPEELGTQPLRLDELRAGKTLLSERHLLRKDGSRLEVEISARMFPDGRFQGLTRDVSQRKQAERELEKAAREWQQTFDASQDAIWILDAEQRIQRSNQAAQRMFGRSAGALLGQHCYDIVHEDARPHADCPMRRACAGRCRETMELRQGERWFEVQVDPILGAQGQCEGAVHLVTDITERKRLQAQIAQADRLTSMGTLAAGVAHEINNPLAYVLYNIESLAGDLPRLADAARRCTVALRQQLGDAGVEALLGDAGDLLQPAQLDDAVDRMRQALGGVQRIKEVTRGLGSFARVEQVEQGAVDLRHAIDNALRMAGNEIKFRARLVRDLNPVPLVWASEGKLSQVFLNLILNAAHATPEGDVEHHRIGLRTWSETDKVFAEVSDTGSGIAPENLQRIFEPFFSTKGPGKGSGLGLAICKSIVHEFGGDIEVHSELGQGSRFVVHLPVRDAQATTDAASSREADKLALTVRGRVLVIDDEEMIRKTMQRVLGRAHEVVAAASGAEGQAILDKDAAFDVILCDLMMPDMTGMDLHRWLAGHNPALARQVVFVTGGAFTPKASEYLGRVDNLRVEKPFDAANLRRLVGELVRAVRGGS